MARLRDVEEDYEINEQHGLLEEEKVELDTSNAFSLTRNTVQNTGSRSKGHIKNSLKQSLHEQFTEQGVEILDVMLHDIDVPDEFRLKLVEESKSIANTKEVQLQELSNLLKTIQEEEKIKLEQSIQEEKITLLKGGEYDELVQNFELLYQNAKSQELVEKIQAQTYADVKLIDSESDYTVQKLIDAANLEAHKIVEEAKAESAIADEEANGEAKIIEALADMESAYFDADGQKGKYEFVTFVIIVIFYREQSESSLIMC